MDKDKGFAESVVVQSREQLYQLTRADLMQEFKVAQEEYRKAKNRAMGIRMAIRGLSMTLGLPIPEEGQVGPILPEEREHWHNSLRQSPPGRSNLAPRDRALSQLPDKPQGNKDDKV